MKKSWKLEVLAYGETTWSSNALRFATDEEALQYGADLLRRWMGAKTVRAIESDDPVSHVWIDAHMAIAGQAHRIEEIN